MKNNKLQSLLLVIVGLVIIGVGVFVYKEAHTIYPDTDSSRLRDFNWLLRNFGRVPTALLFVVIGLIPLILGLKGLFRKMVK